jgi:hypothetical protein
VRTNPLTVQIKYLCLSILAGLNDIFPIATLSRLGLSLCLFILNLRRFRSTGPRRIRFAALHMSSVWASASIIGRMSRILVILLLERRGVHVSHFGLRPVSIPGVRRGSGCGMPTTIPSVSLRPPTP